MPEIIEPIPGDPSTEPVATAAQSHVNGRVGPPTIAQDAAAETHAPEDVAQIAPGAVMPGDYAGPERKPAAKASTAPADPKA